MFPPIIGYNNRLTEGTVTGNGTNPENAYDGLTYDAWITPSSNPYLEVTLPSAARVDYYAVSGHDLKTQGAIVKLQYDPGGGLVDVPGSIKTPVDDTAFMQLFTPVESTKFRFVIGGISASAQLAVVNIGERLELQRGLKEGFTSPLFGLRDVLRPATSETGESLGTSLIRSGVSGDINIEHLDDAWVREHLVPFIEHDRRRFWFFAWNARDYPEEIAFVKATASPRPEYESPGRQRVSFSYQGRTE